MESGEIGAMITCVKEFVLSGLERQGLELRGRCIDDRAGVLRGGL